MAIVPPAATPTAREASQPNMPTQAGNAWRLRACDVLFLWDVAAVTFTHQGTVLKPHSAIDSGELLPSSVWVGLSSGSAGME